MNSFNRNRISDVLTAWLGTHQVVPPGSPVGVGHNRRTRAPRLRTPPPPNIVKHFMQPCGVLILSLNKVISNLQRSPSNQNTIPDPSWNHTQKKFFSHVSPRDRKGFRLTKGQSIDRVPKPSTANASAIAHVMRVASDPKNGVGVTAVPEPDCAMLRMVPPFPK